MWWSAVSDPRYNFYNHDLAYPGQSNRMEVDGDIDGWYRIGTNAKHKHMMPVVIWHDAQDAAWVQIGNGVPFLLDGERGLEFQSSTWLSCEAVDDKHHHQALIDGVWWDGRSARKPPTPRPATDGGSEPPAEPPSNSSFADDIEFWEDELDALKDAAEALPPVLVTEEQAIKAEGILQRLRRLWKTVDNRRDEERQPLLQQAAAIQAKYKQPLLDPAEATANKVKEKVNAYLREQERKQREEERLLQQREAEARAKLNMAPAEKPVTLPAPKIASGEGKKATSLRTTYVGVIEDQDKFIRAIKNRADFQEYLQTTANALARAKVPTKGMRIEERR